MIIPDLLNDPFFYSTPQTQQSIGCVPTPSIPRPPHPAARTLVHKPKRPAAAQRVADLIFLTLKSYPGRMLREKALPPFIHPKLVAAAEAGEIPMEPLLNCLSLVHMISSGIRGSRKLFWKNVRLECEHVFSEAST